MSQELCWRPWYSEIVSHLGFTSSTPNEEQFARGVANWQASRLLPAHGVLDRVSWEGLKREMGCGRASSVRRSAYYGWRHRLTAAQQVALAITSRFETGSAWGTTVSPLDGISFGLLQWNLASGTLQALLRQFVANSGRLESCFGPQSQLVSQIASMTNAQGVESAGQCCIAKQLTNGFFALDSSAIWCRVIHADVRARLQRARRAMTKLGLRSVRGFALLFDIDVGDYLSAAKVRRFDAIIRLAPKKAPLSEVDKLAVIARAAASLVTPRLRRERLLRRMIIVRGHGSYRGSLWTLPYASSFLDAQTGT